MKKFLAAAGCALMLCSPLSAAAAAGGELTIDGVPVGADAMSTLRDNTTYISLRTVSTALDSSVSVSWEGGAALVRADGLTLSARPGDDYMIVNGQEVPVQGILISEGRTLVPVRALAQAFGASVYWDPVTGNVNLTRPAPTPETEDDEDKLYWLSRIISAESRGEPLEGQIAVGNVVLNRVADPDFPDTIYGVIFDDRWGGQFEPVRNGTVYLEPTQQSIQAARLCLEGADVVGDCLYFLAPALAQNLWTPENREFVMTIGCHDFYK